MIVAAYVMSFLSLLLNASISFTSSRVQFFFWSSKSPRRFVSYPGSTGCGRVRLLYECPRRTAAGVLGGGSALYILSLRSSIRVDSGFLERLEARISPSRNHICSSVGNLGWPHTRERAGAGTFLSGRFPHRPKVIVRRLAAPRESRRTGLAFIYLMPVRGGILDKDSGTRPSSAPCCQDMWSWTWLTGFALKWIFIEW